MFLVIFASFPSHLTTSASSLSASCKHTKQGPSLPNTAVNSKDGASFQSQFCFQLKRTAFSLMAAETYSTTFLQTRAEVCLSKLALDTATICVLDVGIL